MRATPIPQPWHPNHSPDIGRHCIGRGSGEAQLKRQLLGKAVAIPPVRVEAANITNFLAAYRADPYQGQVIVVWDLFAIAACAIRPRACHQCTACREDYGVFAVVIGVQLKGQLRQGANSSRCCQMLTQQLRGGHSMDVSNLPLETWSRGVLGSEEKTTTKMGATTCPGQAAQSADSFEGECWLRLHPLSSPSTVRLW